MPSDHQVDAPEEGIADTFSGSAVAGTSRRRLGRAAGAGGAVLGAPAPASATPVGGPSPSNYQTRLLSVQPPLPGVTVRVAADARLELTNDTRRDLLVLGYHAD